MHLPRALFGCQGLSSRWSCLASPWYSSTTLRRRDDSTGASTGSKAITTIIPIVVVVGAIVLLVISYFVLRSIRRTYKDPKYIPTNYLKNQWVRWTPKAQSKKRNNQDHLEPISETGNRQSHSTISALSSSPSVRAANERANEAIDRHTSVRSVMTLPAYNPMARDTERVLGREGERAGIDVVLEYPESDIVAEQRRDEEMEALYQIRLARRTEAANREERRRLQREARERHDHVALEELRLQARAASNNNTLEAMRAEHERIRSRERAVSAVSYGDLGVARHDGTRIRANSEESERPLLADAESMAANSMHTRNRSRSSVLSIDTVDSDFPNPQFMRDRANSRPESSLRRMSTNNQEGSMSSPELINAESDDIPEQEPPEYVDVALHEEQGAPPEYFSPVEARAPELPSEQEQATEAQDETDTVSRMMGPSTQESGRTGRGVGGVPQLPSLRLTSLPRITLDSATPVATRAPENERETDHD